MSTIPLLLAAVATVGAGPQSSQPPRSYVLDFTAGWCGPCQQMGPLVSKLHREGYPIYKVDVDERPELVRKYRISSIPAFVLVIDGKEVRRLVGGQSEGALRGLVAQISRPPKRGEAVAQAKTPGRSDDTPKPRTNQDRPTEPTFRANVDADAPLPSDSSQPVSLASSTRIRVRDDGSTNLGSGTIISSVSGRTIILTCGHILREMSKEARIDVDLFTRDGVETFQAEVMDVDLEADLGLISIRTARPLTQARVATGSVEKGEDVTSIGCGRGEPPTRMEIQVTALNRYLGPDNIECSGVPVQGRSGGGLFNRRGEVVGVCIAADPKEKRGLYTGLQAIHELLDRSELTALYDPQGGQPRNSATAGTAASNGAGIPVQTADATRSRNGVVATPTGMTQAAEDDSVHGTADGLPPLADAEVVCIIRPRNGQAGPSRVVIINRASEKFVEFLTREVEGRRQPANRSHYPPADDAGASQPMGGPTAETTPPPKPVLQPAADADPTPGVAPARLPMTDSSRQQRNQHLVPATLHRPSPSPRRYRRSSNSRF